MPKIRSLKREVLRNEALADAGLPATLVFIGLIIAIADDDGRFKASTRYIKQECVPYHDITDDQVGEVLACLATERMIGLYEAEGKKFGIIAKWERHQRVPESRYEKSELPPPPAQLLRILRADTAHTSRIHAADGEQAGGIQDADSAHAAASPRARADRNRKGNRKGKGEEGEASPNGDARRELSRRVRQLWAEHHGYATGEFPRFDAIAMGGWLNTKPYPLAFWEIAFARVPKGAKFVYLTVPPVVGQVPRVEEWFIEWRDAQLAAAKTSEKGDLRPLSEILRQGAA